MSTVQDVKVAMTHLHDPSEQPVWEAYAELEQQFGPAVDVWTAPYYRYTLFGPETIGTTRYGTLRVLAPSLDAAQQMVGEVLKDQERRGISHEDHKHNATNGWNRHLQQ